MAKPKGWFKTSDRDGDRTVEQQLVGLDGLLSDVAGKTVLDVGCAEGMMDAKLIDAGAKAVHGIEIVSGHVDYARRHAKPGMTFELADAAKLKLTEQYDVVLLLAILHKLKDPAAVALKYAKVAREMVVVRLPPAGAVVTDARSGGKPQDIGAAIQSAGFTLQSETRGTFDEWIGYYVKAKSITAPTPAPVPAPAPTPPEPAPAPPAPAPEPPAVEPTPVEPATTLKAWPFPDPREQAFEKTTPIQGGHAPLPGDVVPPDEAHPTAPAPPNSEHPSGDPTPQLPPDKIEMPQMEGERQDAPRRRPATRDPF